MTAAEMTATALLHAAWFLLDEAPESKRADVRKDIESALERLKENDDGGQ